MVLNILTAIGMAVCISLIVAGVILKKKVGTLRVDQSDPDGPYLFLELEKPLHTFMNKKYVVLEVKVKDYIPRQ